MPIDNCTRQPLGLLQSGASVVLSESVGSMASGWVVGDASHAIVGIGINANHLNSASNDLVMGITRPIKMGKKLHRWSTEIFDENEELICVSRLTTLVKTIKNG